MELWLKKKECTGCSACANICPKNAISMIEDESGFKYPKIDKEKCINCGLCKKTCPIINIINTSKLENSLVYAGWSKNENIRYTSTSGGLFTEITKYFIKEKGFVVGASYNEDNLVEHRIVSDYNNLEKLKQSKYLQSNINNIFSSIKKLLDDNNLVAFCGAPCQVAGLNSFLKKEYDNLLTIEFICRGMNSPKAFKSWLNEIEYQENKKVKNIWFKYKINGWKNSPKNTRIDFDDNSYKIYNEINNTYMIGYLDYNLFIRPCCGDCKFNGLPRQADITLADFWGINKELDDDKGTSLIMVNSNKGLKYFEKIKDNIFYEEKNINEIYEGNGCFNKSVKINRKSESFLKELDDTNFSELIKKYGKISILEKTILKSKKILKKVLIKNKN